VRIKVVHDCCIRTLQFCPRRGADELKSESQSGEFDKYYVIFQFPDITATLGI